GPGGLSYLLLSLQGLAARGRGDDGLRLLRAMRQRLRESRHPGEQVYIIRALSSLGPLGPDTIADLLAVAEPPIILAARARPAALEALAECGPALVPQFPRLVALSRRPEFPSPPLGLLARVLVRLVPHVPEAMDRVRELLREMAPAKGEDWE